MAEQIIQVIDALCSKFGIAIDWSAENVIPYITELSSRYANYVIVLNVIYLVIYAILVFAGIKAIKWICVTINKFSESYEDHDFEAIALIILAIIYFAVMFIYSLVVLFGIIPRITQAITMPELVFFNKVMSYLN